MTENQTNKETEITAPLNRSMARTFMEEFALAVTVLTRLPLPHINITTTATVQSGIWAYPLAGALVGLIASSILWLAAAAGLSAAAAILFAMSGAILASGALHEDGWADFCDGIGGGKTRDEKLSIMRDSHIGVYGVVGIIIALALQWALLWELSGPAPQFNANIAWQLAAILVAAHTISRANLAVVTALLPSVRTDGLSANAERPTAARLILSLTIGIATCIGCLGAANAIILIIGALAGTAIITLIAKPHVHGYTGDVLGAAVIASQLTALTALAIANTPA